MLQLIVIIGLLASFVMLLLSKWNYFEKFRIWTKLEPCVFCHCFWISFLLVVFFYFWLDMSVFKASMALFAATPVAWFITTK